MILVLQPTLRLNSNFIEKLFELKTSNIYQIYETLTLTEEKYVEEIFTNIIISLFCCGINKVYVT